ncbi:HTH-type transcriptional activator CmpR [Limihaloglobus sulfuriphilus]|uniref:HTH-type transcriptional activator CmpR n=1 Tax=Limihaloglobus sulfuriphilus TaxID=1851148 RepID=A0A1Q2MEJ1_9BACT|nr:LysR family transcriptional regulator [Limihaloglobus sulfuriphilus]AQQ71123.1 HTH-type transcriptional activator CmpR [Limihaloglobus sulfuriphilus]
MHIENLRIFCDLVDSQSFSRAAEKNYISQSAVSQQVAQMEFEFSNKLLDRSTRPFRLTRYGKTFYEAAKQIVEIYDTAVSEIKAAESDPPVLLGTIYSIGIHSVSGFIQKFMKRHPDMKIKIEYLEAKSIYEMISSDMLDIGLVAVPEAGKNYQVYPFISERMVFVCSPSNPLAREKSINVNSIAQQDFIAFEKDVPTRRLIDNIMSNYGVTLEIKHEFTNVEMLKRSIEIDAGVSILPEITVDKEVHTGTLKAIPINSDAFLRPSGIVVKRGKKLSKSAAAFLQLLINQNKQ